MTPVTLMLAVSAAPAISQQTRVYPDGIGALGSCVESSLDLHPAYKAKVRQTCFEINFELCSGLPDATGCLLSTGAMIKQWGDVVVGGLPDTIEGDAAQVTYYETVLQNVKNLSSQPSACSSSDDHQAAVCKMREASVRVLSAYHLNDLSRIFN